MKQTSSAGFTLIEVMISMLILATLAILTTQTMRAGIQDRETISADLARESKVADALRIIRTDVNAAYHYRDIYVTIMNNAAKPDLKTTPTPGPNGQVPQNPAVDPVTGLPVDPAAQAAQQQAQQQTPPEPTATPRPIPPITTGLVGDSESLTFTSLSNTRTVQDSQASDQAKIAYYVKACKARLENKMLATKCLFRAISPYLDEEIEKPPTEETVLLEFVDQFKLRYLAPSETNGELTYVDAWKTGKNATDEKTKDNFPLAVEITLATDNKEDKRNQRVVGSALIPIRFPNNPPKKKPGATDPAQGQQPPGAAPVGSFNNGVGGG